ncbi:Cell division protein FtsH [Candidatus Protochlamydia naegleriophila]|uniref:ATP-dependent zinc metalloprotease FtsH n=1 Tax=Candidatus Protochlamydia naegleriophila TaxID=389348 RepID=A0A0U5ES59_9BACT|nr:ATP-dependent zinc metalloprotease FtsH [Candidatus Protochlamydia naegleriophila]CUI17024.1 Cell division protein FtsH [Candidatus Protochlamydia naegleriophila]
MPDDNKQDFKKGISNSFVWFLMAAFLFALMVQNFIDTKFAKVSFSYQLEHLVNLQLLQPEDSRKIALNDNLVTFSGKFRDRLTEEGKTRYKYLELLDTNHELKSEQVRVKSEIKTLKSKVTDSASMFLQLSGLPVPKGGYVVVDDLYNTPDEDQSVVIKNIAKSNVDSLAALQKEFTTLRQNATEDSLKNFGNSINDLLRNFRSPALGIGSETIKQTLKTIDKDVAEISAASMSPFQQLTVYGHALDNLRTIVDELNQEEDHIRLTKLRSVRNYKETLDEYNQINTRLDDNQIQLDKARQAVANVIWYFNNQELSTRALEKQDPEIYNQWFAKAKEEWNNFNNNRGGIFRAPDQPLNAVLEKTFKSEEPSPNYFSYLFTLMPVLLVILVLYLIFARQMKGMGNTAMNFGKSPARLLNKGDNKITFKDVAGVDEALEELQEIVEFLKNPQKFTSLGGKIPKGVLCIGPPGTGKTLIAKAVAGEADRPFFSISGSDFVEMFVGVGASRIRDLFDQAKKAAPCIIFMDEIDAVGRHRGVGIGGGHDEREQTLNQLLVEMDGFDTNEGVILMAATNRPDVLDKALLRPGRFDRRVIIGLPDIKGRFDILKVHARRIKMDPSVDLMAIARSTPGSSGADLANMLNEAALLAARKGRTAVTAQETIEARDKVLYGKERRSLEIDENEKKTTAYHESGHAVVGLVVKSGDPIDKVTIIPRGMSLGATMFLPKKNRVSYWKQELHDQLAVLMGGRVAEEIFVGDVSSGAQQDIERATQLARSMVCKWGMSDKLGAVAYEERGNGDQYGFDHHEKSYSDDTAQAIDAEVRRILDDAHDGARAIILEYKEQVELMTQMLIEFETLDSEDVQEIVIKKNWDIVRKRERLKKAAELHKKDSVTPPPPPPKEAGASNSGLPNSLGLSS